MRQQMFGIIRKVNQRKMHEYLLEVFAPIVPCVNEREKKCEILLPQGHEKGLKSGIFFTHSN